MFKSLFSKSKKLKKNSLATRSLHFKEKEAEFNKLTEWSLNEPSQIIPYAIISRKSRWYDYTTSKAAAFRTVIFVDIHTTISTIKVAVGIISFVITKAISNQIGIWTTVSTVIVTVSIIQLIMAVTVTNQRMNSS